MNSKETKLMIIENYIDWFTSNEDERKELKKNAAIYVEEDHVDEIGSLIEPIKSVLTSLATDAKMGLTGDWDCTTSEGIESFNDQLTLIDTLNLIEVKYPK
jgi:hypothetical protein